MYGSLPEFLQLTHTTKTSIFPQCHSEDKRNQLSHEVSKNRKLNYYTQDKSVHLRSSSNKQEKKRIKAHEMLKEAISLKKQEPKNYDKHWIQSTSLDKSMLHHNHKLLRAIASVQERQMQDHGTTLYERSFGRIVQAYRKIKTEPIDTLQAPKMADIDHLLSPQQVKFKRKRSSPSNPKKLLELKNSIRWAKKHGKKVNSFYQQLEKSIQLADRDTSGKGSIRIRAEMKEKQEEEKRRSVRRKFLKQIQSRISRHVSLINQ